MPPGPSTCSIGDATIGEEATGDAAIGAGGVGADATGADRTGVDAIGAGAADRTGADAIGAGVAGPIGADAIGAAGAAATGGAAGAGDGRNRRPRLQSFRECDRLCDHSALMFEAVIVSVHFFDSAAMKAAKSCGVPGRGRATSFASVSSIAFDVITSLIAPLSRSMTADGVPAGTTTPTQ